MAKAPNDKSTMDMFESENIFQEPDIKTVDVISQTPTQQEEKKHVEEDSTIQNFLASKLEQEIVKPKNGEKLDLNKLEEEDYQVFSNIDDFLAAENYLEKRYVGVSFFNDNGNMTVSSIVIYEYNKPEKGIEPDVTFEDFKETLRQQSDFNTGNIHFSIQTIDNNLTLDKNIALISSLRQKAIEQDPELNQVVHHNKKQAGVDAASILKDEQSGFEHDVDLSVELGDVEPDLNKKRSNKIKR